MEWPGQVAEEYQWPRGVSGAWLRVVTLVPVREQQQHAHEAFGQGGKPFVAQGFHAVIVEFGLLIYVFEAESPGG